MARKVRRGSYVSIRAVTRKADLTYTAGFEILKVLKKNGVVVVDKPKATISDIKLTETGKEYSEIAFKIKRLVDRLKRQGCRFRIDSVVKILSALYEIRQDSLCGMRIRRIRSSCGM